MDEKLVIEISAEIADLKKQLGKAKDEIKGTTKASEKEAKKIDETFQKVGKSISKSLKVGAAAVGAMGTALVGTSVLTEEYRTAQSKLQTAFESAGASAETASKTYNDLYRVMGESDTAVEAANHLAKLTQDQKELSQWTNICKGVYATFGDSLPIEGLTEAANETAKTGSLTGSLADALNWCGIAEDDFQKKLDKCNGESEREALIRQTLNGAYDDAASKYEKNAAAILAQNEAEAHMAESLAAVGEAMAPVTTMLTEFGASVLEEITPYIQSFAENYLPVISEVLGTVATHLSEALEFVLQHKEVLAVMAGIIAGITAAIGLYIAVAAVKKAMDAAEVVTLGALIKKQLGVAASALASIAPYLLVVAAIAGVIAIIVLCVKHWDEIKAKVAEVTEAIKAKVVAMKEAVVAKFNELKDKMAEKVNAAKEKVVTTFNNIKTSMSEKITAAKTTVLGIFDGIKQGITERIEGAKEKVNSAIEKIKGFFDFSWELPKIKLPHFDIKGGFSLNPPSIPKFSVSWYQHGGVFDKPTMFGYGNGSIGGLGENGAEAVVPLEKNTEWLDKIAERLHGKNTQPIVLKVDGKTFATIACDTINDLSRQRGSIPLKLV